MKDSSLIPVERIEKSIYLIRGEKGMLDSDLAKLYGVATKRLNEQVKRNRGRFPESQFATLKRGQNIKYLPYVFTQHGSIMAAYVLNSERAVQASVQVVRAFVRLRQKVRDYLRDLNAPQGENAKLVCWMEVS